MFKKKIVKTYYFYNADIAKAYPQKPETEEDIEQDIEMMIMDEELIPVDSPKACKLCGRLDLPMYKKTRKCIPCFKKYTRQKYLESKTLAG
jgi:hypothetical protein